MEPWTLRKNYSSEMSDCFSKKEYFQKLRITVIGSSQWQVSVISIFELFEERQCRFLKRLTWRKEGLRLHSRKDYTFF